MKVALKKNVSKVWLSRKGKGCPCLVTCFFLRVSNDSKAFSPRHHPWFATPSTPVLVQLEHSRQPKISIPLTPLFLSHPPPLKLFFKRKPSPLAFTYLNCALWFPCFDIERHIIEGHMGTLVGHVAPGLGFFLIGLWHLFNHVKHHHLHPHPYTSPPWFPTSKVRYLELFLIMIGSSLSIAMELFIGPARHQPFDADGTIPSNHLHNFEHSSISMAFFAYGAFAILLDRHGAKAKYALTQLLAGLAFGQQLMMFHLHSADHVGIEGQYHSLLQIVILVSLASTLMGIGFPKSFSVSFVRSSSILFQGLWMIIMGYMLWTPGLIPKGCSLHMEDGHQVVNCSNMEALHRAKSLVNIEFSWLVVAVMIFVVSFYLLLGRVYGETVEYWTLGKEEERGEDEDLESQKRSNLEFVHKGKAYSMDIER